MRMESMVASYYQPYDQLISPGALVRKLIEAKEEIAPEQDSQGSAQVPYADKGEYKKEV